MMTVQRTTVDNTIAAILLVIMSAVFVTSRGFPKSSSGGPGAGFFPQLVSASIIVLCIALVVKRNVIERDERTVDVPLEKLKRFGVPAVLLLGYLVSLPYAGFLLASIVFCVGIMRYSGVAMYRKSVPVSVVVVGLLQYVFGSFLGVYLPSGVDLVSNLSLPLVSVIG